MMRKTGTREWAEVNKNIYKGCKHNCRYCIDGNTLILMSDGTSQMIKNLSAGDKIVGVCTRRQAIHRSRYACTTIKNIWTTKKQAFEIKLENGTTIICSENHRWLTTRGWKYTFGEMTGECQRPHLTTQSIIKGFGSLILTPSITDGFRLGYLSGIIRGDGMLLYYDYSGRRRKTDKQHHFRLAMTDISALRRTDDYLKYFGIQIIWADFKSFANKPMKAIRTNKKIDCELIKKLICYSTDSEWLRGWLSGIFDAEGSYSEHILRIPNTNTRILETTLYALKKFGFDAILEKWDKKSVMCIRIRGGITDHIRFFNLINTAIPRKFNIFGNAINIGIKVVSLHKLGVRKLWDITTGTENFIANGVISHNCYARSNALRFRQINDKSEWENMKLLPYKLNEPPCNLHGKRIMFPTTHDILPEYIEETIGYLAGWLKCDNEILIVSKPHIECITAICDRLASFKGKILFRFTIGSMDDSILKFWEPNAPSFQERFNSLMYAFEHGFKTSVSCEPFLDDNIIGLVEALLPYINDTIWIGKMNHIRERVDTRGWTENDWKFLKLVENSQTDENIRQIYEHFKNNPKIKWKDSVKKVMHLPEEGIG